MNARSRLALLAIFAPMQQLARKSGTDVRLVVLERFGQIDTAMALGTPGSALADAVVAMVQPTR